MPVDNSVEKEWCKKVGENGIKWGFLSNFAS